MLVYKKAIESVKKISKENYAYCTKMSTSNRHNHEKYNEC